MASRPRPSGQVPTAAEFAVALSAWEGQFVEFKESVAGSLARELVAFANAAGGRIYIGVADNKKVRGIAVNNRLLSQTQDIARNCDPPVTVNLVPFRFKGHDILMIEVPEGKQKPYGCAAGYFLRTGPSSQKLNRSELIEFVRRSNLSCSSIRTALILFTPKILTSRSSEPSFEYPTSPLAGSQRRSYSSTWE
ncbi:MAG: AlbA family DNA-binding domain-containing protein [Candidatus Entotheonellia bacterium]